MVDLIVIFAHRYFLTPKGQNKLTNKHHLLIKCFEWIFKKLDPLNTAPGVIMTFESQKVQIMDSSLLIMKKKSFVRLTLTIVKHAESLQDFIIHVSWISLPVYNHL